MRNGFGLKYIYQFLNIPFLQLQRESLLQQLQINARDMDGSLEEIDSYGRSADNNYDLFIETLTNKRRTKQEALAGDVVAKAKPLEEAKRLHDEAIHAAAAAEQLQQQQQQGAVPSLNTIVQVIKKSTETPSAAIKPTMTTKQKPPVVAVQPIVQQGEYRCLVRKWHCIRSSSCSQSSSLSTWTGNHSGEISVERRVQWSPHIQSTGRIDRRWLRSWW